MLEDVRGETIAIDLRRQIHCMAYNTMMAIVCCTQTELKFYNVFLFNDNVTKVKNSTFIICQERTQDLGSGRRVS